MTNHKGLSAYIAIGAWGGIRLFVDGPALRLTLGFVSLCIMARDLENMMREVSEKTEQVEAAVSRLIDGIDKRYVLWDNGDDLDDETFLKSLQMDTRPLRKALGLPDVFDAIETMRDKWKAGEWT